MERRIGLGGAVAAAAVLIAGCAGTPVQHREATTQAVVELRDAMTATRGQIETTLASLITLMNAPPENLPESYQQYANNVDVIAGQAARMQTESRRIRQRSDAWLAAWKESYARISNPELRTLTDRRREQVLRRFDEIEGSLAAAAQAFAPFVSNLQDVRRVVGNDLSPTAVMAVSGTAAVNNATAGGADAARALEVTRADLDELIEALTTAPASGAGGQR